MSSTNTKFLDIFYDFAKEVQLPDMTFDTEGNCELEYGDSQRVTIHYDQDEESILIFAEVCDLEDSNHRDELLERMMRANLFWDATDGFTLSLCKDDFRVVAMAKYDGEYFEDSEQLEECLTKCAELARDWRKMADAEELPAIKQEVPLLDGDNVEDSGENAPMSDAEFQRNLWKYIRV